MKYVKIEPLKTTFIDGMKVVHEINYREPKGSDAAVIVRKHIDDNVGILGWDEYSEFQFDGELWQTECGERFKRFSDAYDHESRGCHMSTKFVQCEKGLWAIVDDAGFIEESNLPEDKMCGYAWANPVDDFHGFFGFDEKEKAKAVAKEDPSLIRWFS
jgi:hypothetical protein